MQGVGFWCSIKMNVPFGCVVRLRVSRARAMCFSKLMIHRNPLSNFTNIERISSLTKI